MPSSCEDAAVGSSTAAFSCTRKLASGDLWLGDDRIENVVAIVLESWETMNFSYETIQPDQLWW